MTKQHIKFIGICLSPLLVLTGSCNKWLDVEPKTQVKESTQFDNEQGVKESLFTVYQNAAEEASYGGDLTYGLLDILAQRYENKANINTNYYGQVARYNYLTTTTGSYVAKTAITSLWSSMYKTIAQCNLILKNIEDSKGIISSQVYTITKGEALAMRAMCHFDLARLFAGEYSSSASKSAIPYMVQFTVTPQQRLNLSEVIAKCESDFKQAEEILAAYPEIDQIAANQGSTNAELFTMFRQNHMNYWAVKAALARLYLYKGDKENALKYAREVIQSQRFSFVNVNTLNTDQTSTASDMTFSSEHIFSIYVSNLFYLSEYYFKSESISTGEGIDLFSTRAKLDLMYEASVAGYGTDIRNPAASKSLWNQLTTGVVYTKKFYNNSQPNVKQRLIPILKLPEMYYIAAEASATLAEGVVYLNEVRASRLLPALPTPGSAAELDAELLKEYRKEFYGEGQLWFYYKRKNTVTIPDGVGNPMSADKYLFPLPDAEIEFGN